MAVLILWCRLISLLAWVPLCEGQGQTRARLPKFATACVDLSRRLQYSFTKAGADSSEKSGQLLTFSRLPLPFSPPPPRPVVLPNHIHLSSSNLGFRLLCTQRNADAVSSPHLLFMT